MLQNLLEELHQLFFCLIIIIGWKINFFSICLSAFFSPETLLCIQQILLAPGAVTSPLNIHYLNRTKQILATFTDGTVIVCQSEQSVPDVTGTEKDQYKVFTLPVPMNNTFCSIVVETRNRLVSNIFFCRVGGIGRWKNNFFFSLKRLAIHWV